MSSEILKKVVILGTGGTISGTAASAADHVGYTAGAVGVAEILNRALGGVAPWECITEQVAQIDSKDMTWPVWQRLVDRCAHWLARPDVASVVITHGTDTLEETGYLLHRVLGASDKPVVLTCAMRPASAHDADGPQNLRDALAVAMDDLARGVLVCCAGRVHSGRDVQKVHPYRLDPFDSGDRPVLAYVESGHVRWVCTAPAMAGSAGAVQRMLAVTELPWVELVYSHADVSGRAVSGLLAVSDASCPLRGLVVAGTGNGTLHQALQDGLVRAHQAGVRVLRATRCHWGEILPVPTELWPHAGGLSPVKARLALALELAGL